MIKGVFDMAKHAKQISISRWEKWLDQDGSNEIVVSVPWDEECQITIKRKLGLTEMMELVTEIVGLCFNDEDGDYIPHVFDFALRSGVLTHYANFRMPESVEKQYDLVMRTGAYELVMDYADQDQVYQIIGSAEGWIEHKKNLYNCTSYRYVRELLAKVADIADKINRLADQGAEIYGNVDPEQVAEMVRRVAGMKKVDEHELVRAVFEEQKKAQGEESEEKVIQFPDKTE